MAADGSTEHLSEQKNSYSVTRLVCHTHGKQTAMRSKFFPKQVEAAINLFSAGTCCQSKMVLYTESTGIQRIHAQSCGV
jgi:hypothetical protein